MVYGGVDADVEEIGGQNEDIEGAGDDDSRGVVVDELLLGTGGGGDWDRSGGMGSLLTSGVKMMAF